MYLSYLCLGKLPHVARFTILHLDIGACDGWVCFVCFVVVVCVLGGGGGGQNEEQIMTV